MVSVDVLHPLALLIQGWQVFNTDVINRHGVKSILELELMSNPNSGIAYLKKMELMNLALKFATKNKSTN